MINVNEAKLFVNKQIIRSEDMGRPNPAGQFLDVPNPAGQFLDVPNPAGQFIDVEVEVEG